MLSRSEHSANGISGERQLGSEGFQTGHTDDGHIKAVAYSFCDGESHPQAGKAAGTRSDNQICDITDGDLSGSKQMVEGRHECAKIV